MLRPDVAIRNAKPRTMPRKPGDSLGLCLTVLPAGGKLWWLKHRFEALPIRRLQNTFLPGTRSMI
jgi:hypothetical protein